MTLDMVKSLTSYIMIKQYEKHMRISLMLVNLTSNLT